MKISASITHFFKEKMRTKTMLRNVNIQKIKKQFTKLNSQKYTSVNRVILCRALSQQFGKVNISSIGPISLLGNIRLHLNLNRVCFRRFDLVNNSLKKRLERMVKIYLKKKNKNHKRCTKNL